MLKYLQGRHCKALVIFLTFIMVISVPFGTVQTYASDGGQLTGTLSEEVIEVGTAQELADAINSVPNGGTIRLTQNIYYSKGIEVNNKKVTLDLGSYTLNVYVEKATGLKVGAGGEVDLTGTGKLNVSGQPYGVYVEGVGSKAEVSSASGSGSSGIGAYALNGGQITVNGSVWGQNVGAYSIQGGNIIVTNGEVSGGIGAEASGEASFIEIIGNVKGTYTHGVKASHSGQITVHGMVTSTSQDGVYAELGGEIQVNGNVEGRQNGASVGGSDLSGKYGRVHIVGNVTGLGDYGVYVTNGGTAVIDGDVTGWISGAYCVKGEITVNGNVSGNDNGVTAGIENSTITVKGNVIANSSNAVGAVIGNYGLVSSTGTVSGTIIIDGEIQSKKDYIKINDVIKDGTPESRDAVSGLSGYYSYSEVNPYPTETGGDVYATSVVFVKAPLSGMVCQIGDDEYPTLSEALGAVKNGETIKLLQDITHTEPIIIENKNINFDLGDYNLLLDLSADDSSDPALRVEGGGKLNLIGNGIGQLNVKKGKNTAISIFGANSAATVNNVEVLNQGLAVNMYGSGSALDGGTLTVNGNIKAENGRGISVNAKNGKITVNGNITARLSGVDIDSNPNTEVIVNGDLTVSDKIPEYEYTTRGIHAYGNTKVTVTGNLTVEGVDVYGIQALGSTIKIGENVVSWGAGVEASYGGKVTIDGSLVAGSPFIKVGNTEKTAADVTEPTTKSGYLTYSDEVSSVWIGSVGGPVATTPTEPQNFTATPGDAEVTLNWTAPANDGGAEISRYEVSRDNGTTWVIADTSTSHTFTGLNNGTEYTFKVRAVNSAGNGAEVSVVATPEAAPVVTHTVRFFNEGSLYASKNTTSGSAIGVDWPNNPTKSGSTFGGWFTGQNGTGDEYTNTTIITADVDLYAKWTSNSNSGGSNGGSNGGNSGGSSGGSSGGGGGSSGSSTPPSQSYEADVKSERGTETTLPVTVNENEGNVSLDVDSQIFHQGNTVVTIPSVPDIDTYLIGIPVPDLSKPDGVSTLTLNTDTARIVVPSNMLTEVEGTEGNKAQITISRGDKSTLPEELKTIIGDRPLIQITLKIDGKETSWRNPKAPVTIAIPYTPTTEELARPEHITVWYIDDSGRVEAMNGQYDQASSTVIFTTTHFSYYGVVYEPVIRLAGGDRVETSLRIAQAIYPDKFNQAVLATADNYPDALAGSVLAYQLDAPLLLVGSSEKDQAKVLSYLKANLKAEGTVYILGGSGVISQSFVDKINLGTATKSIWISGKDRYDTSVKIAEQLKVKTGTPVILASGENYPDALAVSSIAAAKQYPILLVRKEELSEVVSQELSLIKPSKIYIIGLEGAISPAVVSQVAQITDLSAENIIRIGGANRYATSLAIAEYFNLGREIICLATGRNYPDALAGSVYAAKHKAPIILTDSTLPVQTANFIKLRKPAEIIIFGGEAVIGKPIEEQLKILIKK